MKKRISILLVLCMIMSIGFSSVSMAQDASKLNWEVSSTEYTSRLEQIGDILVGAGALCGIIEVPAVAGNVIAVAPYIHWLTDKAADYGEKINVYYTI